MEKVGKEPVQKKLRKAFLLPSSSVLVVLKIHALKKYMQYKELLKLCLLPPFAEPPHPLCGTSSPSF